MWPCAWLVIWLFISNDPALRNNIPSRYNSSSNQSIDSRILLPGSCATLARTFRSKRCRSERACRRGILLAFSRTSLGKPRLNLSVAPALLRLKGGCSFHVTPSITSRSPLGSKAQMHSVEPLNGTQVCGPAPIGRASESDQRKNRSNGNRRS